MYPKKTSQYSKSVDHLFLIMLETLRQEIETLPIETQERLLEIVHTLKQEQETESNETIIKNYENFEKMSLIGCCSTDQNWPIQVRSAPGPD
jgi:hypothetical protein